MNIVFDGLHMEVIRSDRKTISLELRPSGFVMRVPRRMNRQQIDSFLEKKRTWIHKHYDAMRERVDSRDLLEPFSEEEIYALREKALAVIPEKVKHYSILIGVDYGRITIRNQRTRWGSCSSKGNLNFNCLLMLFPDDVIDSVVVHELCHRKYMNHSPQFYAEIEKVFPEYKRCHQWLKDNGGMYLSRL